MTEYRTPKVTFDPPRSVINEGKTVLKSIIDIVKDKKTPCQMKIAYVITFLPCDRIVNSHRILPENTSSVSFVWMTERRSGICPLSLEGHRAKIL